MRVMKVRENPENLPLMTVKSGTGSLCIAIQLTQENAEAVARWCNGRLVETRYPVQQSLFGDIPKYQGMKLDGLGYDWASIGDFIVTYQEHGRYFYVYTPNTFRAMFQEV